MATWLGSPGAWVDAGSGVLLVLLALFVASRRPRRRVNIAFAVFTGCWGLAFVAGNVVRVDGQVPPLLRLSFSLLLWPSLAALGYLALHFPHRLARDERRWLAPAAVPVLLLVAASVSGSFLLDAVGALFVVSWGLFQGTVLSVLWLLAMRFHDSLVRWPAAPRANFLLVGVALLLDPALRGGFFLTRWEPQFTAPALALVALAGFWLHNTRRASGRDARHARNLAWLTLALMLGGVGLQAALGAGVEAQNAGFFGAARTLGVLVLAYAILRHQLLGIDVKLKWTLKQSTVAAAFIGLFFVVSEAAAAFLSDQVGTYLGIAAAGALVFAIAPLQHLAQRFADRAMPEVKAVGQMSEGERAGLYREQLRVAYQDGAVDARERELLQTARAYLGISHEAAERMERDAVVAARVQSAGRP